MVEIKVIFFNFKSQLFRTIVLCAIPQSASLTTSMLFNRIKSGNLPSQSFAKSKCCGGSFIKIINLTLKTKVSNALQQISPNSCKMHKGVIILQNHHYFTLYILIFLEGYTYLAYWMPHFWMPLYISKK